MAKKTSSPNFIFRLYVSGINPNSSKAIINLKKICEEYLKESYQIEIIDIYQQAISDEEGENIIASPTLIRESPLPIKKIVGDLSNTEQILRILDIINYEG